MQLYKYLIIMHILILFLLLVSWERASAQNLIPNGGFELYSGCPTSPGIGQLDSVLYWINPAPYPPGGSPEYFNQCAPGYLNVPNTYWGYQPALGGDAFCGLTLWYGDEPEFREYIESPLTTTLSPNTCYYFEMYINAANNMNYVSDDIQVYFSDTAITGIAHYYVLPYVPQLSNQPLNFPDTTNWTLVSGTYTATGGENYLVIGNFKDDLSTTKLFLAFNDPAGDAVYVNIDNVLLTPCTGLHEPGTISAQIFPNPVSETLHVTLNRGEFADFLLYDIASRQVLKTSISGVAEIDLKNFNNGIYVYEIVNTKGLMQRGKIIKN